MLEEKVERVEDYLVNDYGIFKLTARECGRLMAVNDEDIDKMESVISKSQMYKCFGNSIVVTVLMAIFSQLHIKGVKPWNDMSQDERQELIDRSIPIRKGHTRIKKMFMGTDNGYMPIEKGIPQRDKEIIV